jgi:HK97 family phage portal protein
MVGTWRNVVGYIREAFGGAWQSGIVIDRTPATLLAFSAVYACVTGIASDIAKMRIKLNRNVNGIWEEIDYTHGNDGLTPVLALLRRPNGYQNRIQFITCWILSKLLYGNAYVLKQRDSSGVVVALYVLYPRWVWPLVASDGSVYYSLNQDYLSEVSEGKTIPASEIIHDRMPELWHPLVGVSPLYACAMSVTMGNKIQANSTAHAGNASRPGGIVTVPGEISDETATRLKSAWETNYGGMNSGRVAILGDGMKFDAVHETAEQSQLVDQLKWTVSDVARAFHYPEFKLGGDLPRYAGSVDALITSYYTDCLQTLIESLEICLDEGLGLPNGICTEVDTDALMRMDTAALFKSNTEGVTGGWLAPNEARQRTNLPPVAGGASPMIQQQNYSLAALAKRDAKADPFPSSSPAPATAPAPATDAAARSFEEFDIESLAAETLDECLIA